MQLAEASQRLSAGEFTLQFQIQCGFPGKPVQTAKNLQGARAHVINSDKVTTGSFWAGGAKRL
jgi:hypothetical protein